jgi:hypothetical protein
MQNNALCRQKHLSVRCEAIHIGATRFEINKMVPAKVSASLLGLGIEEPHVRSLPRPALSGTGKLRKKIR